MAGLVEARRSEHSISYGETPRGNQEYLDRQAAKHGRPARSLMPEELDRSETEIHKMLRRGPAKLDPAT